VTDPEDIGLIAMAAGAAEAIADAGESTGRRLAAAAVLGTGAALFLAGDAAVRRLLRIGSIRLRIAGAGAALATIAVGPFAGLEAQLGLVTVLLVVMLLAEQRWDREPHGGVAADAGTAG
jgi:low temperature requirement protein LtrA